MHIKQIPSENQLYYKSMQQKAAIPCRRLVDFCYKLFVNAKLCPPPLILSKI